MGGGVPLLCSITLISGRSLLSSGSLAFLLHRGQISSKQGKKGQKLDFLWCGLVFSRDFRRPKRAKFKIYFNFDGFVALLSSSFVVAVVVSAGAGVQALRCYFADVSKNGLNPLPFVRLPALLLLC